MSRLAVLLCLIAVATAQVPLIACTSDCHEVVFAGVAEHDCHGTCVHEAHADHVGCHDTDCGHDGEPDPPASEHDVFQVPVLRAGSPVELPAAAVAGILALAPTPYTTKPALDAGCRDELQRDAQLPGPPDDLLASVRLLL